ncbi:hypothetical protein JW824_09970 [bacterium]|nr:hypothetical protein [bacterium]
MDDSDLLWRYHLKHYDQDDVIETVVKGVCPSNKAKVRLKVDRFIGGGFAGQVYRVQLQDIQPVHAKINGLRKGEVYAVKIGRPPSSFALWFRNLLYFIAFQAPFAPQLYAAAARSGTLWQKLIRRGMLVTFGSERVAVDTYGTFYDTCLQSWGEINEWIDGRNWKFEIDDCVFQRGGNGSKPSEYWNKRLFMNRTVQLCHEMGAHEFARQYEWWTAKSQPNVLKRLGVNQASSDGLTAIDFRAGLVLLPFLPMSPADFRLILAGMARGSVVQFDRGDLRRLEKYIRRHRTQFKDLFPVFQELRNVEEIYRSSLPDITHHGIRILTDSILGRRVIAGTVEGLYRQELIDDACRQRITASPLRFGFAGLVSVIPLIGKFLLRLVGNRRYVSHVKSCLFHRKYLYRYLKVKQAGILLEWQRSDRACSKRIYNLLKCPLRFWIQDILFGWLPPKWHRFLAEPRYAWNRIKHIIGYPIKLYFNPVFREEWLLDMVKEGHREGMLSDDEKQMILHHIKDPYIQIYLKALAVHVCTLPLTQVISLLMALFAFFRYGNTWAESIAYAAAVLAFFQVTPISPGSLARGGYVVYLMIRDRSIKNYWIAALVSFWHYIGYLGFPLQMVTKYPFLARFMAGRWATQIVHIIPVFGERGALLEYAVFDLFFNVPLSIRKWFQKNDRKRGE